MDLTNVDLLSLQPQFLQKDPMTIALCKAFQPVFETLAEGLKGILIYTNIDHLSGPVLDELAWGMNVTWYNTQDTLAARRETIKRALSVFARMGTAGAIKDAVAANFGDSVVEEWWEYGADPGYFRIIVEDPSATAERAADFVRTVNAVKHVSSWLDQIILMKTSPGPLRIGTVGQITRKIRSVQRNG